MGWTYMSDGRDGTGISDRPTTIAPLKAVLIIWNNLRDPQLPNQTLWPWPYILKASSPAATEPKKNWKNGRKWPQMAQRGPKRSKMAQEWPKMAQKWPALFPHFFLTEKAVPQTFLLLECMPFSSNWIESWECQFRVFTIIQGTNSAK